MDKKVAFIGTGNMGGAMVSALSKSNAIDPRDIIASSRGKDKLKKLTMETSTVYANNNVEAVEKADYIFLCVEPKMFSKVIDEIKGFVSKDKIIISIAAGISTDELKAMFHPETKIVRIMPNTPIIVSQGMTMVCENKEISPKDMQNIVELLSSFSNVVVMDEKYMNAFVAVAASSPAFIYIMIEAMADAAVAMGLSRRRAYPIVAQAVLGSAKMVLESGKHPGELKDMVCSPAGTTIDAVASLEKTGFRSSIIEALKVGEAKCSQIKK